jgi:hypothetical protein
MILQAFLSVNAAKKQTNAHPVTGVHALALAMPCMNCAGFSRIPYNTQFFTAPPCQLSACNETHPQLFHHRAH